MTAPRPALTWSIKRPSDDENLSRYSYEYSYSYWYDHAVRVSSLVVRVRRTCAFLWILVLVVATRTSTVLAIVTLSKAETYKETIKEKYRTRSYE